MDAHCLWINNCVGIGNYKYYVNLLVYSYLLAGATLFMMADSLITLLSVKNMPKNTWKQKQFWPGVIVCVITVYLALYLFNHLQLLIQEQFESLVENQGFIDDLKNQYGCPYDTWSNCKAMLGDDVWWWFVPTQATYKINYCERVWSKKDIVQMYRLNEFFEDDKAESDEDHMFRVEQARREKWFILSVIVIAFIALCLIQDSYLKDYDKVSGKYLDSRKKA